MENQHWMCTLDRRVKPNGISARHKRNEIRILFSINLKWIGSISCSYTLSGHQIVGTLSPSFDIVVVVTTVILYTDIFFLAILLSFSWRTIDERVHAVFHFILFIILSSNNLPFWPSFYFIRRWISRLCNSDALWV